PNNDRELLKNLFEEVCERLSNFFGVEEFESLKNEFENIVQIYTPTKETFLEDSPAHFDPKYGKIRIGERFFETYKDELDRLKEELVPGLAEEITHLLRYRTKGKKGWKEMYHDVEEFFGYLARLAIGEKPGTGKNLMKEYKMHKKGEWYTLEELNKKIDELERKALYMIDEIKTKRDPDKFKERFAELLKDLYEMKYKVPFEIREALENNIEVPLKYHVKYTGKYFFQTENPDLDRFLEKFKDNITDYFKLLKKDLEETLFFHGKKIFEPYEKRFSSQLERHLSGRIYGKWKSLEVHAKGYATAEEIFKYIQEGKINPKDLFYRDPASLKKYFLSGGKLDYAKKLGYKMYAEYRSKLKKYLLSLIIPSILFLSLIHSSSSQGYFILPQEPERYMFFLVIIIPLFFLFYYYLKKKSVSKR
ncbi:MAG: hypothetical protein J7K83_02210, partial [Candidatus Aenigmarchaeota archaeon]|nr:hypothetical protein [Candidatus Aenigmarchaeota archaeon]